LFHSSYQTMYQIYVSVPVVVVSHVRVVPLIYVDDHDIRV